MKWTPKALASIPDELLLSEAQRRRARKRASYTGGAVWAQHNPDANNCRCQRCITKRAKAKAKGGAR